SLQKLLFSPDGKALAFQSSLDGSMVLLDTATGKKIGSLRPVEVRTSAAHAAITPDGRCLALERGDGAVLLYEWATGQLRRTDEGRLPPAVGAGGAPEDELFAAFRGRPAAGEPSGPPFAISPDGTLLAHAGPDGSVHVLDLFTGQDLAVLKGHTAA